MATRTYTVTMLQGWTSRLRKAVREVFGGLALVGEHHTATEVTIGVATRLTKDEVEDALRCALDFDGWLRVADYVQPTDVE